MTRRLLLVRHASTGPDHAGRLIGATDVRLDAAGREQAQVLGSAVARYAPQLCWSSPLARCRETAALLGVQFATALDADLREIDFGRWENRTFAEVAVAEPEAVARWAAFDPDFAFPDGEPLRGFLARVRAVAERLIALPAETLLVVTHGGVIRALLCHLLGLEARQYVVFDIGYASLAALDIFGDRGVLVALEPAAGREVACGAY